MRLSIIIPVYNEHTTILEIINRVENVSLPAGVEKEILVIDDGSTDGTAGKLKNLCASHTWIKLFHLPGTQGKTAAVKHGLRHATGNIFVIQDADLEYNPEYYRALLDPILKKKAKIVYGSRFLGKISNMTLINRMANTISNFTINMFYRASLTDFHTCLKMFLRETLEGIEITSRKFSFDTELTVKFLKKGYTIHEIPIEYHARSRDEGKKINWDTALESYWVLLSSLFSSK